MPFILVSDCCDKFSRSREWEMGRRVLEGTSVRAVSINARERRDLHKDRPPPVKHETVEKRISMSSIVSKSVRARICFR